MAVPGEMAVNTQPGIFGLFEIHVLPEADV